MLSQAASTEAAQDIDTLLSRASEIAIEYLQGHGQAGRNVNPRATSDEIERQLDITPGRQGQSLESILDDVAKVLDLSPRTGHPSWCNQLFAGYDLPGIVGEWMVALLNTTMATYEAAPVGSLIERAIIEKMCSLAHFNEGDGIFTPGGSISNLMAILAARLVTDPDSNTKGVPGTQPMALFTSTESHYSIARGAMIAGLGTDAACLVDVDHEGRMDPVALTRAIEIAQRDGRKPMFVCATAGTTVYGAYDPIEPIADIARQHGMWLHIDGAYGGSALLSQTHRHLLKGVDRADSLTWCPHKMMGAPLPCSALLVRKAGWLAQCNTSGAQYLFHDQPDACYDTGEMSLQCGRRMDALKLWLSWRTLGDEGYEERIDHQFELARRFADMVRQRDNFKLVKDPTSCNALFHYLPPTLGPSDLTPPRLDELTRRIRQRVIERGRVMINFAPVDDIATFRMILVNPRATEQDLALYLDEIEIAASEL